MFSWHWSALNGRGQTRGAKKPKRASSFRPQVGALEDRVTPTGLGGIIPILSGLLQSGPATHVQVVTPDDVQSGKSFDVLVEAETASNRLATGYTGTVHFSLGTADTGAAVPSDYTFKASDHGVHIFQVTLDVSGSQTISATDTKTSTITGLATLTVDPAPVATQFLVRLPDHVTSGQPTSVSVVALDSAGRPVTNYAGTVSLTSSDGAATLPANYTFTADDHGRHTFQVTFGTSGSQTVTATDTAANSTVSGTATTTVDAVGAVTHFGVRSLGIALAGTASPVQIVALDASNHIVTNYAGTIHFTSTDSAATLPADYTFTANDKGSHQFTVTFMTAGKQTLTATDAATGSTAIVGAGDIFVLGDLSGPGRRRRF